MRKFTAACLTIGLILQVGCALSPKLTVQKKPVPNQKAAEKYLAARQLESHGKFEQARERYEEMLETYPENPDYLHRLAVVCTHLERYGESTNYFERALKRDPKNASLLADMGYSYYVRGDQTTAERLLRESIHLKPSNKRATTNLALVLGTQGKTDESLSLLRQAGDEASALACLAYIHSQRGEVELAEQRYRESLALDPTQKEAIDGLVKLEKQRPQEKLITAKMTAEKLKSAAVADVVIEEEIEETDTDEILQVSTAKKATAATVTTAAYAEESKESDEPKLFDEDETTNSLEMSDVDAKLAFDESELPDEELEPVVSVQSSQGKKPKAIDWDDEETLATKPVKSKPAKGLSSLLDVEIDSTDDDELPSEN